MKRWLTGLSVLLIGGAATAQQAAAPRDAELDAASAMIGRALFLRCFCGDDHLTFGPDGQVSGAVKKVDWTVSGVNVLKVARRGPDEIELDGVRAAVRFTPDRGQFDRKPQKDEPVRLTILTTGDAAKFEQALDAVFTTGIDRAMELSTPPYWRHYFDPSLPWAQDALTGQKVISIPSSTSEVSVATVTHRAEAGYTPMAANNHVTGDVKLRFVVDADGRPQRIAITQPLGYGLDEMAVQALEKYRFRAAMVEGKPVASNVTIDEAFR
jgi:TonB family protein